MLTLFLTIKRDKCDFSWTIIYFYLLWIFYVFIARGSTTACI